MTAGHILRLIVAVDPSDTAAMDEIDARVDAYLAGYKFVRVVGNHGDGDVIWQSDEEISGVFRRYFTPLFSRSRDALKAIRPEGWFYSSHNESSGGCGATLFKVSKEAGYIVCRSPMVRQLATEELAELHAIIQAIHHERDSKLAVS